MICDPRLVLIGSSGRNSGKTTLATRIIRQYAAGSAAAVSSAAAPAGAKTDETETAVYALKVTGIETLGAACPRHGAASGGGCGACSIAAEFCLTRETDPSAAKDTSLLLAAGAREVWWLRSLRAAMERGYAAFSQAVPAGPLTGRAKPLTGRVSLVIAESNSLRRVVRPALFIMLRDKNQKAKETALEVMDSADIILPAQPDEASIAKILAVVRELRP